MNHFSGQIGLPSGQKSLTGGQISLTSALLRDFWNCPAGRYRFKKSSRSSIQPSKTIRIHICCEICGEEHSLPVEQWLTLPNHGSQFGLVWSCLVILDLVCSHLALFGPGGQILSVVPLPTDFRTYSCHDFIFDTKKKARLCLVRFSSFVLGLIAQQFGNMVLRFPNSLMELQKLAIRIVLEQRQYHVLREVVGVQPSPTIVPRHHKPGVAYTYSTHAHSSTVPVRKLNQHSNPISATLLSNPSLQTILTNWAMRPRNQSFKTPKNVNLPNKHFFIFGSK